MNRGSLGEKPLSRRFVLPRQADAFGSGIAFPRGVVWGALTTADVLTCGGVRPLPSSHLWVFSPVSHYRFVGFYFHFILFFFPCIAENARR